jgi:hypothetical protein
MSRELTQDNSCRLARALIERHEITYEEAMYKLANFRLNLECDDSIADSAAMQAALITAVNAGKRAFHGGINVRVPEGIQTKVPWPGQCTLSEVCRSLGANLSSIDPDKTSPTIYFYAPSNGDPNDFAVAATGWRGGVSPANSPSVISSKVDFSLGGVLAGSLAVGRAFLFATGIETPRQPAVSGSSLWNPGEDWLRDGSDGPSLSYLPRQLCFLGLGHLGQAYAWNLALLPYAAPEESLLMLLDYDRVVHANIGTGLLSDFESLTRLKTRVCAEWLERRRFRTLLVERLFDARFVLNSNEPYVALCAFDSAAARSLLEIPHFDAVIEAGLGNELSNFDQILLHTFPGATKKPEQIWKDEPQTEPSKQTVDAFDPDPVCGVVAETLARKAISTAFVGAAAGSLVIGEVLRGLHGGKRAEFLRFQIRRDRTPTVVHLDEDYQLRFGPSGYLSPRATRDDATRNPSSPVGMQKDQTHQGHRRRDVQKRSAGQLQ